ncbi:iron complex transport system permease protein [Austwickia chelonae]|uniref:Putative ABC transporter permease protein n=1 Tax=Austwickia chelonae NBRC 105200 TaxID=1184607 RepID=K6VP21_9MICO|nr:iron chelate uptake ABC transporter family permease subunit [Austwickia chelonae]GAB78474.1 putative ABC transporter permease protein [Austwickia chelonae NBRC 105200]SEW39925.1 iron complex transport system permease protein [Austwickia chelonae]
MTCQSPPVVESVAVPDEVLRGGRRHLRVGPLSLLVSVRNVALGGCCLLVGVLVLAAGLTVGDYPLTVPDVLRVLGGFGNAIETRIVVEWRLARALVAGAVGLALGLAGALTQNTARNALASPDILGISMGASAAAVAVIAAGATGVVVSAVAIPVASLVGSLATAAAIYLLAWKQGIDTYRLVLIGIGVNSMLASSVTFVLVRADLNTASRATMWLSGSVNGRSWPELVPLLVVLAVTVLVLPVAAHELTALRLGEDSASALGVDLHRVRRRLLFVAIALTAVSVAAAGPVGFVAFVAPQLARRIFATSTPPLVGSALCGSLLVLTADLAARTFLPWELPVGIVTAAIGGPFLLYVIIRTDRKVTL